jgi:hypothetical protein
MTEGSSQQLQQRRQELVELPQLTETRAATYRLNSDARARSTEPV